MRIEEIFNSPEDLVARWIKDAQVKPSSIGTYTKSLRRLREYLALNNISNPTR